MNINAVSNNPFQAYTGMQPATQSDRPAAATTPITRTQAVSGVSGPRPNDSTQKDRPDQSVSDPSIDKNRSTTYSRNPDEFTAAEKMLLESLQQIDQQVKRHEMAHVAAGGRYITSGANFSYKKGPDGVNYAVGGEVGIDTSPVPGDPEATLAKMRQVKQAALAPADPSAQDIKVASMATAMAAKAMTDLMMQQAQDMADKNEATAFASHRTTAESYTRIKNLPEQETSRFTIAV